MSSFVIEGGNVLSGRFQPSGNKNAALPMIAASLLTDEEVVLGNIPRIEDVLAMLEILQHLGADISWRNDHEVAIRCRNLSGSKIPEPLASKARTSLLFAGPLLARTGQASMFPPGGDVIGRRRLDSHFQGLRAMGVDVSLTGQFTFHTDRLQGSDIFMEEASVTATEHLLIAAATAKGTTVLSNCASEPHVRNLAEMLLAMGANIRGVGTNQLTVEGVERLHGCNVAVEPDYIEAGTMVLAAILTGGTLEIESFTPERYPSIFSAFRKLNIQHREQDGVQTFSAPDGLRIHKDEMGYIPKIDDAPWPGFPSDMMSSMIVAATQCEGTVLFFEKMFERRMVFVDRLISMGAQIIPCDPHRIVVVGPSKLRGIQMESPDIRAGMALVSAALCADGASRIANIRQIDRGYERLEQRLRKLGARIERVDV